MIGVLLPIDSSLFSLSVCSLLHILVALLIVCSLPQPTLCLSASFITMGWCNHAGACTGMYRIQIFTRLPAGGYCFGRGRCVCPWFWLSVCLSVVRPPKWSAVLQVKHSKLVSTWTVASTIAKLPTGLPHDNGTGPDLLRSSFYF